MTPLRAAVKALKTAISKAATEAEGHDARYELANLWLRLGRKQEALNGFKALPSSFRDVGKKMARLQSKS